MYILNLFYVVCESDKKESLDLLAVDNSDAARNEEDASLDGNQARSI